MKNKTIDFTKPDKKESRINIKKFNPLSKNHKTGRVFRFVFLIIAIITMIYLVETIPLRFLNKNNREIWVYCGWMIAPVVIASWSFLLIVIFYTLKNIYYAINGMKEKVR